MYRITGSITYSNTTNRNTANTAVATALSGYSYTGVTSMYSSGINLSGNTVTISIEVSDADVSAINQALITAWSGPARLTTGYIFAVVKV